MNAENHIPQNILIRKILIPLILFPVGVLIPLTFIMMLSWDYLVLSQMNIFNWERIVHIITLQQNIPFIGTPITPLMLILGTDILSFILYLWHLQPIFHYLKTGEGSDSAEKRIFTGFNLLFWPGFLILGIFYGSFFLIEEALPPIQANFYHLINICFLGVVWAIFVLACMLVVRIAAIPVVQMIGRHRITYRDTIFLDRVLGYVPTVFFSLGIFLIYQRSVQFLMFYGSQTDPLIPSMTSQYPVFCFLLGMFLFLITGLNYLISFAERKERAPINMELQNLSQGKADLTQRLVIPAHNNRGIFVSLFNDFLEKFQRQTMRMKTSVDDISGGVNILQGNFQQIVESTAAQKTEMEPLETSVKDISRGMGLLIGEVREKYDYISENIRHVNDIAEGIENIILLFQGIKKQSFNSLSTANIVMKQIQESMEKSRLMSESMTSISKKIQDAGKEAEHIDEILILIQDISEQTNILSINAAIEAAHAGDDGKGFAIVANEVRTLATESSKAVEHISQKLLDIQKIIRDSVEMTLIAEQISQENGVLVTESHRIINQMIEQFHKTGRITENTAAIIAQQGGITRNFHKQVRSLIIFFENLRNTMSGQEASFEELHGILDALKDSFHTASTYNTLVHQSIRDVAQTEGQLAQMVGVFKTE